jgi:hypothetical protein
LPTLHYGEIMIPGLAADRERVPVRLGLLQRTHPLLTLITAVVVLLLMLFAGWRLLRHRRKDAPAT